MKQSVQAPVTTKSVNRTIGANRFAHAAFVQKQRDQVTQIINATFARRLLWLEGYQPNAFTVTLCRISAGTLDDDNLRGALKNVRDAISRWIGLDDNDVRIAFTYEQQACPKGYLGLRITIEDKGESDVETSKVLGASPGVLGAPSTDGRRGSASKSSVVGVSRSAGKRERPARELPFRRCFAQLPWDPPGVVTELEEFSGEREPPARITVRPPIPQHVEGAACFSSQPIELARSLYRDVTMGEMWLFLA